MSDNLSTEEIKKILIDKYGKENWKRISKSKKDGNIIRLFSSNLGEFKVISDPEDKNIIDIKKENSFIQKMKKEIVGAEYKGVSLDIDSNKNEQEQVQNIINQLTSGYTFCKKIYDGNPTIYQFYKKDPGSDIWGNNFIAVNVINSNIDSIHSRSANLSYDYIKPTKSIKRKSNGYYFYVSNENDVDSDASDLTIYISSSPTNQGQTLDDEPFPDNIYKILDDLNISEDMECIFTYDGEEKKTRNDLIKMLKNAGFTED